MVLASDQTLRILLLQKSGDRREVRNDLAVHVDDVDRAVRPDAEVHRAEPLVGRRQEFRTLLAGGAAAGVGQAVTLQNAAMDEVVRRITDEVVSMEFWRERVGPVDQLAAGGREEAVRLRFGRAVELDPLRVTAAGQPPRIGLADGENLSVRIQRQIARR